MPEPLRIGITGASGFIGRHAVRHFIARGDEVHAYQRKPAAIPGAVVHHFEMPAGFEPHDFDGIEVLIHAALVEYGPAHPDADRVNREATERLIAIARARGTRLI